MTPKWHIEKNDYAMKTLPEYRISTTIPSMFDHVSIVQRYARKLSQPQFDRL
jgi:hypothetical protein